MKTTTISSIFDEDLRGKSSSFLILNERIDRSVSSSTIMTSGEEEDLACSFKTVIHRPNMATTMGNHTAHFYLPSSNDHPTVAAPAPPPAPLPPPSTSHALTPPSLMSVAAPPLPIFVLPSATALPLQHHAHTDPDLLYYNQAGPPAPPPSVVPPVYYSPSNWFTPYPPTGYVYGAPVPPQPPPSYGVATAAAPGHHLILGPPVFRSSSVDCRRTVAHAHDAHVMPPERVS